MLLDNPQSKPLDASLQQHLNQTLLTLPHIEVSNPSDPNCILKMDQNRADQLLLVKRSQPVELLSGALKILRIIAKSRQEGINAIVLSQTSGEPSKEVFRYLKVLLQEQIVFKMPIAYNKGPTSLLIHAHYVRYSSVFQEHMRRSQHVSSITNETTRPLRMNTVEAFLTLLRNAKNKTMSTYDLKHCLQIPQEHSALKSYYSLTSTMQQNKQIELIRVPMVIHEKERLVNCYRLLEDNTEKEVVEKEPIEIRGFDYHQTLEQQLYFCIRETPSLSTSEISTSLNTAERMISVQVDTLTSAKKVNITTTQQQRSKVLRYHVQGHKGEKHSFEKRRAALLKLVQSEKVVPVIRNSCKTLDEILGSETSTDLKTMLRDGDYLHRQRKLRKHVVTYLDSNRKRAVKTLLLQNDLETSHPLVQDCVQQLSLATMRTAKEPLTEEMEVDLMQLPGRRKTTASIAERNAIARSYGYYYCHCYRLRSVHVWLVSLGQTQSLHINYLVDNASLQLILQIFGCLTNNDYLDKLLEVPGSLKLRFLDIQKDHPEVFDSIFTVERRSRNRFKHSLLLLLQRLETMHLISIDNDAVIVPQEITLFDYSKQPMEPLRQIQVTTEEEAIQFWTDLESDCRLKMGALDSDHPFAYLYLSGNWRQQAVLKPEERTKLQSHIKETELGLFTPYRSEYQLEQAARDANVSIEDAKSFYRLIEQEHRKKNGRVLDLARPNKIKTLNKLRFKVKPILQRKMWPEEEDQRVIMAAAILSHVSSKIPWSRLGKTFGGRTHSSVGSRFRKIVKNGNNLAIFNALKSVWPNYGRAYEPVTRETIVDLLDFFQARIERDRVFEKVNEFMPVQAQTEMRIDIKDYLDGNYDFKFERTPTWLQVLGTVSRPIKNAFWNHSSQGVSLDPDFVPETWQVVFGNLYTISKVLLITLDLFTV
ncbi:hypothetical protein EDD86DRAFT_143510 [Gorgonomyces haynaldii]|nr:hypothetical protein EDD86DRAFT_143510 [Gorgonomyces haynaldii]